MFTQDEVGAAGNFIYELWKWRVGVCLVGSKTETISQSAEN